MIYPILDGSLPEFDKKMKTQTYVIQLLQAFDQQIKVSG
jgi:hypothetical protein